MFAADDSPEGRCTLPLPATIFGRLPEDSRRQIESTDDCPEKPFSNVPSFVISNRHGHGSAVDIGMVNHPMRPLAAIGEDFKPGVILPKDSQNIVCSMRLRHTPAKSIGGTAWRECLESAGCVRPKK